MCGIAGLIDRSGKAHCDSSPRILARLNHRGPDDCGFLRFSREKTEFGRDWSPCQVLPEVVLLHRRLSILDLTDTGWQPMGTVDGRYYVTFNGEIYNYVELREELERLGHQFRSQSDTEVLLAAWAHWGVKALNRFIGMFAFALLDTWSRTLACARDPFGIKPFYYSATRESFAFASEIKALFDFGVTGRDVDRDRLLQYLRYGACKFGSATMFADVHQLPPGHFLLVSLDGDLRVEPVCYWRPATTTNNDISFEEAAKRIRELFLKSVKIHLRSDVPVGATLSGGIDSSSIVMAAREVSTKLDLHTFTYVAERTAISEENWADLVASTAHSNAHKTRPRFDTLVADLNDLMYAQDEPFGGTSMYAQFCVFRMAHDAGIKVVLDGQGADEMLGGYRFYMGARLASLLRQRQWESAAQFLLNCSRHSDASKLWLTLVAGEHLLPAELHLSLRKLIGKNPRPPWLNCSWFPDDAMDNVKGYGSSPELLKQRLFRTLFESNLPNLLRYEDRNSMAFSVESRVPFLIPEMTEFILSLPERYIISEMGVSKSVFRRAMRGIVPDAVLDRADKIGFATPQDEWLLAGDWVTRILGSDVAESLPFFDIKRIRAEWNDMQHGKKPLHQYVWRWVNLVHWTQRFDIQYQ